MSTTDTKKRPTFKIKGRISYPNIFRREVFQGEEGKFSATFLIPKSDVATLKTVRGQIDAALKEAGFDVAKDRWFIKDGDASGKEEYKGHMVLKASENKRPLVMNRDKSILTEDDNVIYGGCEVNAMLSVWVQNNSYGKRVNCNLLGVQFAGEGERFGDGGQLSADEIRDAFDDESEFGNEGGEDFDLDDESPF